VSSLEQGRVPTPVIRACRPPLRFSCLPLPYLRSVTFVIEVPSLSLSASSFSSFSAVSREYALVTE